MVNIWLIYGLYMINLYYMVYIWFIILHNAYMVRIWFLYGCFLLKIVNK